MSSDTAAIPIEVSVHASQRSSQLDDALLLACRDLGLSESLGRELRQIDGIDQGIKDGRFYVVIFFRMPAVYFDRRLRTRLRCRRCRMQIPKPRRWAMSPTPPRSTPRPIRRTSRNRSAATARNSRARPAMPAAVATFSQASPLPETAGARSGRRSRAPETARPACRRATANPQTGGRRRRRFDSDKSSRRR